MMKINAVARWRYHMASTAYRAFLMTRLLKRPLSKLVGFAFLVLARDAAF
jgi:hypothetical protein